MHFSIKKITFFAFVASISIFICAPTTLTTNSAILYSDYLSSSDINFINVWVFVTHQITMPFQSLSCNNVKFWWIIVFFEIIFSFRNSKTFSVFWVYYFIIRDIFVFKWEIIFYWGYPIDIIWIIKIILM